MSRTPVVTPLLSRAIVQGTRHRRVFFFKCIDHIHILYNFIVKEKWARDDMSRAPVVTPLGSPLSFCRYILSLGNHIIRLILYNIVIQEQKKRTWGSRRVISSPRLLSPGLRVSHFLLPSSCVLCHKYICIKQNKINVPKAQDASFRTPVEKKNEKKSVPSARDAPLRHISSL